MNEVNRATLYPVLPLRDIVVFPHMIVPLFVGREKSVRALEDVMKDDKQILLATQKNAAQDDPQPDDIYTVGTIGTVLQLLKLPDGTVKVLVEGGQRARISNYRRERRTSSRPMPSPSPTATTEGKEVEALARSVVSQFEQYIKLNKKIPPEVLVSINQIEDPSKLADTVASHLGLKIAEKQELLETESVVQRLERVFAFMEGEIGVLQVEKRIRSRVKRQMEKTQREYYLNEQLKAIQKELGDGEDGRDELAEIEERIGKTKLSKEAREKALAEVKKLRSMSPMSAEATVVRNYLDWLLGIPWNKPTKVKHDIKRGAEGAQRRPLRAREGQGAHPRISRRAAAHEEGEGPDPLPGRPARRRQDLARQVDRAGHGPQLRPHVAGRRARRGRDPRPSPDLYRLDARQGHPGHEEGEVVEPAVPARRDRQARRRLARRSVLGAARGAGSRAELDLQRPLSRGRLRSVGRDVRHHGEHAAHAAAAARPHGDHPHPRLHRG